jgi:hypothetical protein
MRNEYFSWIQNQGTLLLSYYNNRCKFIFSFYDSLHVPYYSLSLGISYLQRCIFLMLPVTIRSTISCCHVLWRTHAKNAHDHFMRMLSCL